MTSFMRPLRRFLIWLRDSLPWHLYSNRDLARVWQAGYFDAIRVRRGKDGKFTRI